MEEDRGHETPCWIWKLACSKAGYGVVQIGGREGKQRMAHRVAYEDAVGPIPSGLEIDHICNVRSCVRPSHLQALTMAANNRRNRRIPEEVWKEIMYAEGESQTQLSKRLKVGIGTVSAIRRTMEVLSHERPS